MATCGASSVRSSSFSAVSALAATVGTSLGPRGEVVIVVFDDGSKEMEITLINCQAEEPDKEGCHHVP
jgi:chaperonin GroEL (HSP60 family)